MVSKPRSLTRFLFVLFFTLGWGTLLAGAQPDIEAKDDYTLFHQFTPSQRAAIYPSLDAETKSYLWRRHLELYLEEHPKLPALQWSLIQEALDLLTPELFADLRWPGSLEFGRAEETLRGLSARARDGFTQGEWARCFGVNFPTAPPPSR